MGFGGLGASGLGVWGSGVSSGKGLGQLPGENGFRVQGWGSRIGIGDWASLGLNGVLVAVVCMPVEYFVEDSCAVV